MASFGSSNIIRWSWFDFASCVRGKIIQPRKSEEILGIGNGFPEDPCAESSSISVKFFFPPLRGVLHHQFRVSALQWRNLALVRNRFISFHSFCSFNYWQSCTLIVNSEWAYQWIWYLMIGSLRDVPRLQNGSLTNRIYRHGYETGIDLKESNDSNPNVSTAKGRSLWIEQPRYRVLLTIVRPFDLSVDLQ